jgi:hypothetical protein
VIDVVVLADAAGTEPQRGQRHLGGAELADEAVGVGDDVEDDGRRWQGLERRIAALRAYPPLVGLERGPARDGILGAPSALARVDFEVREREELAGRRPRAPPAGRARPSPSPARARRPASS